jgi:hypothetical protein
MEVKMIKTIIKESGIVLLLLLATALILGILFYEYLPNSKTVPIQIEEYALDEDVQKELKGSVSEGQNIVKTFYIDSTDLDLYESTKDYNKGKADPFADYTSGEVLNSNTNTTGNSTEQNKNEVYIKTPGKNS